MGKSLDRTVPSYKNDEIFEISIQGFYLSHEFEFQGSNWNHDELERYNPYVQDLNLNHDELERYNPCVQDSNRNHDELERYNLCVQGSNWNHYELESYNPCFRALTGTMMN